MATRRLEYADGSSDKFWEIDLDGATVRICYGRTGTAGQQTVKDFDNAALATAYHDKQLASKLKKGYTETGAVPLDPAAPTPAVVAPAAAKTATPAAKPAAPAVPAGGDDRILLTQQEWSFAPWRPVIREPRPAPAPFDPVAAMALINAHTEEAGKNWAATRKWQSRVPLPVSMTRQEAWFWLSAIRYTSTMKYDEWSAFEEWARAFAEEPPDDEEAMLATLVDDRDPKNYDYAVPKLAFVSLIHLLSPERVIAMMLRDRLHGDFDLAAEYTTHFAYYLTDAERARCRALVAGPADALVASRLAILEQPGWHHGMVYQSLPLLAAALGHCAPVKTISEHERLWLSTTPACIGHMVRDAPTDIREHNFACYYRPGTKEDCIPAIAQYGEDAVEIFAHFAKDRSYQKYMWALPDGLGLIISPRTAPVMWYLLGVHVCRIAAAAWLNAHLPQTVAGLAGMLSGRGESVAKVQRHLQRLRRVGHDAAFAAALERLPVDTAKALQTRVIEPVAAEPEALAAEAIPGWLDAAVPAALAKKALPDWLDPVALPPLTVDGQRLHRDHVLRLLAGLRAGKADAPHEVVAAAKAALSPAELDEWAGALFEIWDFEGQDLRQKWVFEATGHLGGDACVERMTPRLKQWPSNGQGKHAKMGLDLLGMIANDRALMQIARIAQRASAKSLQKHAEALVVDIAARLGMSSDELADRCVPDFGFDEAGVKTFLYGRRQFQLLLEDDLTPRVRDETGSIKPGLPRPNKDDDDELVKEAKSEWAAIKKTLGDTLKMQVTRLERAMVSGRSWSVREYEEFLAQHPVMSLICRRILWAVTVAEAGPPALFRLTAEQAYADVHDDPVELPAAGRVHVVHPLHMDEDSRNAWGAVFADYAITAAFPQLGRPVYGLDDVDPTARELRRGAAGETVAIYSILHVVAAGDWQRDTSWQGDHISEYYRPYPAAGQHVILRLAPGYFIGSVRDADPQELPCATVYSGTQPASGQQPLALREVDPVLLSETILELETIARAKR